MKRKISISLLFFVFAASMNAQSWPRFFWNQIIAADTVGAIAIATPGLDGAWSDSLRFWQGKLRIGQDTAATKSYARSVVANLGNKNLITESNRTFGIGSNSLTFSSTTDPDNFVIDGGRIGVNVAPSRAFDIESSEAGLAGGLYIKNTNTGAAAYSSVTLEANDGTLGQIFSTNSTYSPYRVIAANTVGHYSGGSGGMAFQSDNTASSFRFGIGTNEKLRINSIGLGVGGTPSFPLHMFSTSAIKIPSGTDIQRPLGEAALFRFSTTTGFFEGHNGVSWVNLSDNHIGITDLSLDDNRTTSLLGHSLTFSSTTDPDNFVIDGGRIGVNVAPSRAFDIESSEAGVAGGLYIKNTNTGGAAYSSITLEANDGTLGQIFSTNSTYSPYRVIAANTVGHYSGGSGGMAFQSDNTASSFRFGIGTNEKLRINSIGLGVGGTPSFPLDVFGDSVRLKNFVFDTDQDTTGLDGYVLGFNSPTGQISLIPNLSGADGNGIFSSINDGSSVPGSYNVKLTDSLSFGTTTYPDKIQFDSMGILLLRAPTHYNSTVITTGQDIDWSNLRGPNLIIGTNLSGDTGTQADYDGNVIIGPQSYTDGGNNNYWNTVLGYDAYSSSNNPRNTVIGAKANTQGAGTALAVGYEASASASNAAAIGPSSSASAFKAIAIGYSSTADEAGEITLGDETGQTKLNVGNYTFNIDQSAGSAQDEFELSYNNDSEEILLKPTSRSTRAQLIETVLTSLGTLSTSYEHVKSLTSQNLSNFTATDSTLTYTGSETILVEINYSGSVFFDISTSGTYNTHFLIYINGTQELETTSIVQMTADGSEDWIFPFSGTTWVELSTSDVISLRRKGSSALTASLSNLSLTVKAL